MSWSSGHRRCWVEVSLDALRENLLWIKERVGASTRVITVVKADAYGHGLKSIAALLMQSGTDMFGVSGLAEAEAVRSVGAGWPILMLGAALPEDVEAYLRAGVTLTISSREEVRRIAQVAVRLGRVATVHLKVDTGMGRLGVYPEEAAAVAAEARSLASISLTGLYTHFPNVEGDAHGTRHQWLLFRRVRDQIRNQGGDVDWVHASNSGGVLLEKTEDCTAVRPGLLVYGVFPTGPRLMGKHPDQARFKPALSWKTRVTFVKDVAPGTRLSYGGTFTARKKMRVATVSAGYGDGYLRVASDRGQVLIQGMRCDILGRITMDQMLVDVSRCPGVAAGEEVVLIGQQGDEELGVQDVAAWMETIPWEVLTGITYRVPRIYRGGEAS